METYLDGGETTDASPVPGHGRSGPATDSPAPPEPRILFIAGIHRSGTTVLARLLGAVDGCFCAGELNSIWDQETCGCGLPIAHCPVWSAVLGSRAPDGSLLDPAEMRRLREHIRSRPQQLVGLWRAARTAQAEHPAARYGRGMRRVFCAISHVTGAEVIVDSTKTPHFAYMTAKLTGLPVSIVHLVRDPRAVAYSWARMLADPSSEQGYVRWSGPAASSARWAGWNALIETAAREAVQDRYCRIRYEDFVRAPASFLRQACAVAGVQDPVLPHFIDGNRVNLDTGHTVGGNRVRFNSGVMSIQADDEWRARMAPGARALATLPAVPLLRHYGYEIRP